MPFSRIQSSVRFAGSALRPPILDSSLSIPNCRVGRAASGSSRLPIVTLMLALSMRRYVSGVPQALQNPRSTIFELAKIDGRPSLRLEAKVGHEVSALIFDHVATFRTLQSGLGVLIAERRGSLVIGFGGI